MEIDFGDIKKVLEFPPDVPQSEIAEEKQAIIMACTHMVNNSFSNPEAKEYLKEKISVSDQIKNYLYLFFKRELQGIIQARMDYVTEKTAVSTNQNIIDVDWDVNIVAGGKGISKLFKRVASVKITSQVNKAADNNGTKTNEVQFEIDTESGNSMMKKLEELERVFNL